MQWARGWAHLNSPVASSFTQSASTSGVVNALPGCTDTTAQGSIFHRYHFQRIASDTGRGMGNLRDLNQQCKLRFRTHTHPKHFHSSQGCAWVLGFKSGISRSDHVTHYWLVFGVQTHQVHMPMIEAYSICFVHEVCVAPQNQILGTSMVLVVVLFLFLE